MVVAAPLSAAISELLLAPGAGAGPRHQRPQRKLHSAPSSDAFVGMRRWPLPTGAEPRLVVRPQAPRKISSLPALTTGFAYRSTRTKLGGRIRAGSVPLNIRGRPVEKAKDWPGLRGRSAERAAKAAAAADPTEEPQASPTSALEARFHIDLQRVAEEVTEVRKRQLSTRKHLQVVQLELSTCEDEAAAAFKEQIDVVKAEVSEVVDGFLQEWDEFRPVSDQLEALGTEVDGLTDTDQRMKEVLERMSSKLDAFDHTLGRDMQYWG